MAGGVIRDVLVGDVPQFFRPGQLFGSILIGALLLYYGLLISSRVDSDTAAWTAITFAALARWLVICFNWRTTAVNDVQIDLLLAALQSLPRTVVGQTRQVWRNVPLESDTKQEKGES